MPIASDHALPRRAGASAPARRLDPNQLGDHIDRLYRAAWALCGSREDAEDLVQDTYARVLQRPRMLRSEEDIGYLLRVLRNTHFSRLRAAARRPRADPLPDELDRLAERVGELGDQPVELGGVDNGLGSARGAIFETIELVGQGIGSRSPGGGAQPGEVRVAQHAQEVPEILF